jgi:tRNA(fMet)-specific endonuclease VapC
VTLLRKFLLKPLIRVVDATLTTSEIYSEIKNNLKKAGSPIPINDVWIAAHVIESGAQLITYDQHFKKIKDLRIWDKL